MTGLSGEWGSEEREEGDCCSCSSRDEDRESGESSFDCLFGIGGGEDEVEGDTSFSFAFRLEGLVWFVGFGFLLLWLSRSTKKIYI